ncbi:MAG: hypothetical protein ACTHNU_10915 [Gaiellales bacterium]
MTRRALTAFAVLLFLAVPMAAQASISATPLPVGGTDGRVDTIIVYNGVTYIGGSFTTVTDRSGHSVARSNLAALNSQGNPTSWNPGANGEVRALAASGSSVFVGGSFTTLGGRAAKNIGAVSTGGAYRWGGGANGTVRAVRTANGRVFIGGTFSQIQGQNRSHLGSLSAAHGGVTTWNPHPNGTVYALLAVGSRIYVGGAFTAIHGHTAPHLVDLDQTTGGRIRFAVHPAYPVTGLALGAHLFVAGGGPGGHAAAFTIGGQPVWTRVTDGALAAVGVAGAQVVFGGHFSAVCRHNSGGGSPFHCTSGIARLKVFATLPNGGLLSWAPRINSALGVFAVRAGTSKVWVGGDFTSVGTTTRQHLTRFAYTH